AGCLEADTVDVRLQPHDTNAGDRRRPGEVETRRRAAVYQVANILTTPGSNKTIRLRNGRWRWRWSWGWRGRGRGRRLGTGVRDRGRAGLIKRWRRCDMPDRRWASWRPGHGRCYRGIRHFRADQSNDMRSRIFDPNPNHAGSDAAFEQFQLKVCELSIHPGL